LRSIQPGEAIHVSANRCPGDSRVIPHEVGKKRGSNGVRVRTAFLFERSGHGL
jgi:hypothetical protein